jgi:two-component system, NtrC family, sensor histidine kinase AtoS
VNLVWPRSQKLEAFDALLESLPHSALLVEQGKGAILAANTGFIKMTNFTRAELVGLDFRSLLTSSSNPADVTSETSLEDILNQPPGQPGHLHLLGCRNKPSLPVRIIVAPLDAREKRFLLIFAPLQSSDQFSSLAMPDQFWNNLITLPAVLEEPDSNRAMEKLLETGSALSDMEAAAIYCTNANSVSITRYAAIGLGNSLPAELSLQDLIQLNYPRHWQAGKRTTSVLHRQARAIGLANLASAPIGPAHALSGFVVLGSSHIPAYDYSQHIAQLIGGIASVILQQQNQLAALKSRLEQQNEQAWLKTQAVEFSREGVFTLNTALQILEINPAAEMMLGYSQRDVIGQPFQKVLIGAETLAPTLLLAQKGETTVNLGETHLIRRNGEAFQAQARVYPVRNNNQVSTILVIVQDLSEQEQIRLHAQQLEQQALLGEVTAVFAHEVRNPINNISTGLQLLSLNLPSEDANQETIARMLQDCDRLAELMRSVLAFSRPTEYEMEALDPTLLLQRLVERLRPRITKANVQPHLQSEADCPLIMGNLRALEQVFSNLINNALQAMSKTGGDLMIKIQSVRISEEQTCVEVSVADTGPGIPKELVERIFMPFFTTERGGTGLGLAIAKRIVAAHKGNLRLSSFPGGTVFYVQLPVASSDV